MTVRHMRLRRYDGAVYLERWALKIDRLFGLYLHRMEAPDPGLDLHDHPWTFASLVIKGGYIEERAETRSAPIWARLAEEFPSLCTRGLRARRRRFSVRVMRLDECHRVIALDRGRPCWTLVFRGPRRRPWGFYTPDGYIDEHTYDETIRVERRDLWNEPTS